MYRYGGMDFVTHIEQTLFCRSMLVESIRACERIMDEGFPIIIVVTWSGSGLMLSQMLCWN